MEDNYDEIENFDSIENEGVENSQRTLSNVYPVKVGGFGENQLKTYISSVTLNDLEADIQFYETLSRDKSWPVSQIIQREVDKRRVTSISKDYILGQGRVVKYFPPIIVALLPKGLGDKIDLKYKFESEDTVEIRQQIYEKSKYKNNDALRKIFVDKSKNISVVDGFYLLEVSKVFDFNVICWDKSKYFAIVIDGQHRLDALIRSKSENSDVGNYVQDVVFIDFSYLIQEDLERHTPVELVRRVFIDINTNAKKVGVVRQILMDDKDFAALLVQSLVDSVNKDGTDKNPSEYLKSQLVDWYGESLKHNLPHITGVLSLYQILSDYIIQYNISSIDSLRKPKLVEKWVAKMNERFFVDREIASKAKYQDITTLGKSLQLFLKNTEFDSDVYDDSFKETALFRFDYSVLEVGQRMFESIYSKSLVKLFDELLPYHETIQIINENKGFDPESLLSVALLSSKEKLAKNALLRDSIKSIRENLEEKLYNKYYLLFTVLGQKSVFNIYFKRVFRNINNDFNNEKCLAITSQFIKDFNELLMICLAGSKNPFGEKDQFQLVFEEEVKAVYNGIATSTGEDGDVSETVVEADNQNDNIFLSVYSLGTLLSNFWEGIIYENNKIIYNSQGIASLTSAIEFMLLCVDKLKKGETIDKEQFNLSFVKARTTRIIKRNFGDEWTILTDEVLMLKGNFIKDYLTSSYESYKKSQV